MSKRKLLLSDNNKQTVARLVVDWDVDNPFNPPKFVLFKNRLFKHTGGSLSASFYREAGDLFVVPEDTEEMESAPFHALEL